MGLDLESVYREGSIAEKGSDENEQGRVQRIWIQVLYIHVQHVGRNLQRNIIKKFIKEDIKVTFRSFVDMIIVEKDLCGSLVFHVI